jgi:hypothetical protein
MLADRWQGRVNQCSEELKLKYFGVYLVLEYGLICDARIVLLVEIVYLNVLAILVMQNVLNKVFEIILEDKLVDLLL